MTRKLIAEGFRALGRSAGAMGAGESERNADLWSEMAHVLLRAADNLDEAERELAARVFGRATGEAKDGISGS